jgi:serine protease
VGPAPQRQETLPHRRPVVAILDTGCGRHPWLDRAVTRSAPAGNGESIGYDTPFDDPEVYGDLTGQLDGLIDPLAGHGTFIAGLVHQACPDADILSWRAVPADGPIVESDLITILAQVAEFARTTPIDVLSLSMGYYHETPKDQLFDKTMHDVLVDMTSLGTLVVCSAGNDATSRPSFPAAFAPWEDDDGPVQTPTGSLPIVSVGALNPDEGADALFSNAGPWVRAFAPGAALMSTMPRFEGGLQPLARTWAFGRRRESIDPDNFRSGFGLWSGTSFSAPVMAGRLAAHMLSSMAAGDELSARTARAWEALEAHTELRR